MLLLSLVALAYVFLVSFGALSDLSTFRIPNWVSYGLVLLFLLQSIFLPVPGATMTLEFIQASPLALNLGIGLFVLIVCLVFWGRGYIGGGDAKFLVATSLWMGPIGGVYFMILVSGLSVLMALMLKASANFGFLIHAGKLPAFIKQLYAKFEDKKLPFGFPIGIAALIMMPQIFST
jgi:prepilin peptidase CpaA